MPPARRNPKIRTTGTPSTTTVKPPEPPVDEPPAPPEEAPEPVWPHAPEFTGFLCDTCFPDGPPPGAVTVGCEHS